MTSSDPAGAGCRRSLAARSPMAWTRLLIVVVVGLALDLGLKHWSFANVAPEPVVLDRQDLLNDPSWRIPFHRPMPVVPGVIDLQLVDNRGAVFGIGADQRMFFIAFTVCALIGAMVIFARWTGKGSTMPHIAIGLVLAGGLGNLHDRIQFAVVRDCIHMFPGLRLPFGWRWPGGSAELFPWVFNVADVLLLVGMIMLMVHLDTLEKHRKIRREKLATQAVDPDANAQSAETEPQPDSA